MTKQEQKITSQLSANEKNQLDVLTRANLSGRPGPKPTTETALEPLVKQLRPGAQPYVAQRAEQDVAAALSMNWIDKLKAEREPEAGS